MSGHISESDALTNCKCLALLDLKVDQVGVVGWLVVPWIKVSEVSGSQEKPLTSFTPVDSAAVQHLSVACS